MFVDHRIHFHNLEAQHAPLVGELRVAASRSSITNMLCPGDLPDFANFVVGPVLHEDVGEHLVAAGPGTVVHAVSSSQKHPFAVVGRPDEMAFLFTLCLGRFFRQARRPAAQAKQPKQGSNTTRFSWITIPFRFSQ
jgi:hypothetical protein